MNRLRMLLAAPVLFVGLTLAGGGSAFADSLTDDAPVNLVDTSATLRVSALAVNAIVSVFLPLLAGLLTTWATKPAHRGIVDAILTAISALVVQATLADGSAVLSLQTFLVWGTGLAASMVGYVKWWKPAGLTSAPIQVPGDTPGTTKTIPGKLATIGRK